ncbi:acetate kinase [Stenomitos frigidus]|uniref:Acetate kinase n=1 Tax=Stenomitos frigidus ULC18 TaxID=2107698 RepID=A0A2T1EK06_9CYAN|nr:acetate kinase [Stenomitos frigidus]PSB33089.1 acetate kinase [Stenomitos frigidus ULC18]
MKILILNAGSSSQKSCLYEVGDRLPEQPPEPLWEASVDWTHHQGLAEIKVKTSAGAVLEEKIPVQQRPEVIAHMLETLWQGDTNVIDHPSAIDVVGHRVVHGGQDYRQSVRVTPDVKAAIAQLAVLAPVHNPANLEGIDAIELALGKDVPQIAVFDTAFHSQIPDAAAIYPGPYKWVDLGIRRYGFHGISHQYCAQRTAQLLNRDLHDLRLIICHLGNGCSLSAIQHGHSIDTTMGFTPLEGLMMGTRSGSVDPSILIYLMRQEGYTADQLDHELNKASGLMGISSVSADLRQVLAAIEAGNNQAKLALDIYIHRLRSCMGDMLASLGGLDALVFTAGVGENAPIVRALACQNFEFMGLKLDLEKNQNHPVDQEIATADSTTRIFVIHTQEDWAIAQDCYRLMQ